MIFNVSLSPKIHDTKSFCDLEQYSMESNEICQPQSNVDAGRHKDVEVFALTLVREINLLTLVLISLYLVVEEIH